MKFKEIYFENFGPIKTGKIKPNKINVFFGPNNSGKSLVSRLIHGINSIPTPLKLSTVPLIKRYQKLEKTDKHDLYLRAILHKSGTPVSEAISHGKNKCTIQIQHATKKLDFVIERKHLNKKHVTNRVLYFALQKSFNTYDSVYIPAGRTGTIQFFTHIVRIRNQLLNDLLHTFGSTPTNPTKITTKDIKKFTHSANKMPDYLEQFHNLILSSQEDGLDRNIQEWFSELFPGSVDLLESYLGLHHLAYKDPTGFITELESAGSGTLAAFPIIAGMHYVKQRGTLIVEEPEAHLEPSKQLKLLDILQNISYRKNTNLIFTTHSDYIVKKLLAFVSNRTIKHSDLSMYFFSRINDSTTTIKQIKVDKNGDAEQPIFDEAIDKLIEDFSN